MSAIRPEPVRTSPARRSRGFTLLELTVVLGIVAVLTTLAMPSFGGMLARQRLKAAAENLSMDLAELRFQAAQRGVPLHLNYTAGSNWCYTLATVSGCDCRVAQSCQLKTVHAVDHPGVQMLDGQNALFEVQGGTGVGSGRALLQGVHGAQLRVGLSPLGRPQVCAPAAPVSGYPRCP